MNNHRRCDFRTRRECNCHPGQCIQDSISAPKSRIVTRASNIDVIVTATTISLFLLGLAAIINASEKTAFERCLKTNSFSTCQSTMNP